MLQTKFRIGGMLGVVAVAAASLIGISVQAAPAANAIVGVPNAPIVVYSEDFENAPDTGNPQLLTDYSSASPQYLGGRYTAAPFWVSAAKCNGFIVSTTNTYPAGACGNSGTFTNLQAMAPILGTIGGTDPATNSIVAAYTAGNPGANNQIEFATVSPITLPSASRYLTFSVDAVGRSCGSAHPRLQFYVHNAVGADTPLGGVIDPCDLLDPRTQVFNTIRGGHYPASGSFLSTTASIGIVMRNLTGATGGNDGAFDNIQVLDATPALDKSFSAPNPVTGVSQLTFTLTNTTDLATKLGWGARDTLAPGLVVASPANSATTCTNGAVVATPGSGSINVSGDLAGDLAHLTSCTFTVDVVPSVPTAQGAPAQIFQNCAANLSNTIGVALPSVCATGSFAPVAQLSVSKTSTATAATREGDVIDYTVTVTNTGGSDYTVAQPATVVDDMTAVLDDASYNGDAVASSAGLPVFASPNLSWSGLLGVGASVTIKYSMTATLSGDGTLTNQACVPADQASGAPCATVTTTIPIAPAIDLVKSASPSDAASFTLGRVITYSFVVTNSGNLSLANPIVSEVSFDGADPAPAISCPATPSLAPGSQMTCSASYTLVQPDVDNHSLADPLTNVAVATATATNGAPVASPNRSAEIPANPQPAISIDKTAGPGGFTAAGQVVAYSFLVTNTGNVTLTNAGVTEGAFSGSGTLIAPACPVAAASLIPGARVACTATYTLSQQDVDAGTVTNDAIAFGTPPSGPAVVSLVDDAVVTIPPTPAITLVKSAGPGGFTRAGDVVAYTFDVTNTGNVTLGSIGITETAFSGTGTMSTPVCAPLALKPGDTAQCHANYSLTQTDVDSGIVKNAATAQGSLPAGGTTTSLPSDALVTVTPMAKIALTKTVDRAAVVGAGEWVTYSFLVANTGTSTLTGLGITDDLFSGTGALPTASCPVVTLAPSASTTCTTSYRMTIGDVDARVVNNTATASAIRPGGAFVVSAQSSALVTVDPVAAALATTGGALMWGALVSAFGVLAIGIGLVVTSRRRRQAS